MFRLRFSNGISTWPFFLNPYMPMSLVATVAPKTYKFIKMAY